MSKYARCRDEKGSFIKASQCTNPNCENKARHPKKVDTQECELGACNKTCTSNKCETKKSTNKRYFYAFAGLFACVVGLIILAITFGG